MGIESGDGLRNPEREETVKDWQKKKTDAGPTPNPVVSGDDLVEAIDVETGARVTIPAADFSGGGGPGAVTSVNGQTGAVTITAEDVGAATAEQGETANSALQPDDGLSAIDSEAASKLSGIEANADVTDATNVAASGAVMTTGDQSVDGIKTFAKDVIVPDEEYGDGWDGSFEAPTKNAIYDKIESIDNGGGDSWTAPNYATDNLPEDPPIGEIAFDTDEDRLVVTTTDGWQQLALFDDLGGGGSGDSLWEDVKDGTAVGAPAPVVLNDYPMYLRAAEGDNDFDFNHSIQYGYDRKGIDGALITGLENVGISVGDANETNDVLVAKFGMDGTYLYDDNTEELRKVPFDGPAAGWVGGDDYTIEWKDNNSTVIFEYSDTPDTLVSVIIPTDDVEEFPLGYRVVVYAANNEGLKLSYPGITLVGGTTKTQIGPQEGIYLEKVDTDTWVVLGGTLEPRLVLDAPIIESDASSGDSQIVVVWDPIDNATGYEIEVNIDNEGSEPYNPSVPPFVPYTAPATGDYEFITRAAGPNGVRSDWSDPYTISLTEFPGFKEGTWPGLDVPYSPTDDPVATRPATTLWFASWDGKVITVQRGAEWGDPEVAYFVEWQLNESDDPDTTSVVPLPHSGSMDLVPIKRSGDIVYYVYGNYDTSDISLVAFDMDSETIQETVEMEPEWGEPIYSWDADSTFVHVSAYTQTLYTYDISSPENMWNGNSISVPFDDISSVVIAEGRAYVLGVESDLDVMTVVDISDASNPQIVGSQKLWEGDITAQIVSLGPGWVVVRSDLDLQTWDITDPNNPTIVDTLDLSSYFDHDVYSNTRCGALQLIGDHALDTMFVKGGSIAALVNGTHMYLHGPGPGFSGWAYGLVDVSSPEARADLTLEGYETNSGWSDKGAQVRIGVDQTLGVVFDPDSTQHIFVSSTPSKSVTQPPSLWD